MATFNIAQLKEIIKESIKEAFREQDFIKTVVSESVKAAISSVLLSEKISLPQPPVQQQQRPRGAPKKTDLSMFANDLREMQQTTVINELSLKEDPFVASQLKIKTNPSINTSDTMEETESDPDWLLSKLGIK